MKFGPARKLHTRTRKEHNLAVPLQFDTSPTGAHESPSESHVPYYAYVCAKGATFSFQFDSATSSQGGGGTSNCREAGRLCSFLVHVCQVRAGPNFKSPPGRPPCDYFSSPCPDTLHTCTRKEQKLALGSQPAPTRILTFFVSGGDFYYTYNQISTFLDSQSVFLLYVY